MKAFEDRSRKDCEADYKIGLVSLLELLHISAQYLDSIVAQARVYWLSCIPRAPHLGGPSAIVVLS